MADSHRRRKRAQRIADRIAEARAVLAEFDTKTVDELLRRGECTAIPDGLRGAADGSGGPDLTTSVESAALYGLPGDREEDENDPDDWSNHVQPDPVGAYIIEIMQRLDEVVDISKLLDKRRQVVIHAADGRRGRQPTIGHCEACGRLVPGGGVDRLRSGYCDYVDGLEWSGCYRKWVEQHRPDRMAFERWVASQLALLAEQRVRDEAVARHNSGVGPKAPVAATLPNSSIERGKPLSPTHFSA